MYQIKKAFRLDLVQGGCYCYCFKYPILLVNRLNPAQLIGERKDAELCRSECNQANKTLGYSGFFDCLSYRRKELKPSQEFIERSMKLDSLLGR